MSNQQGVDLTRRLLPMTATGDPDCSARAFLQSPNHVCWGEGKARRFQNTVIQKRCADISGRQVLREAGNCGSKTGEEVTTMSRTIDLGTATNSEVAD